MKKSVLYLGLGYLAVGLACLALALTLESGLTALLWGWTGAGIASGLLTLGRYFYWTQPQRRPEYEKRLQAERVALHDERNVMLRDKSGRCAYLIMLAVYCVLMAVGSVFVATGRFMPFARYAVLGLGALLVFQYLTGVAVFRYLAKRR